jgi:hypothetical protein
MANRLDRSERHGGVARQSQLDAPPRDATQLLPHVEREENFGRRVAREAGVAAAGLRRVGAVFKLKREVEIGDVRRESEMRGDVLAGRCVGRRRAAVSEAPYSN